MNLCEYCQRDDLSAEEAIEHLTQLFHDTALLQSLTMIHTREGGAKVYIETGQRIHLTEQELIEREGK